MKNTQSGFTLIELAVVITIITLILAAVIKGQSLYRNSQIRTIITFTNEYEAAIGNFYKKFLVLPGDFNSATSYWSSAGTANGDADGRVESGSESQHVWEHLDLAEMLGSEYNNEFAKGKIVNYALEYREPDDFGYNASSGEEKNRLYPSNFTNLTPQEAYLVDKKQNDGYPGLGDIIAGNAGTTVSSHCTSSTGTTSDTDISTAAYDRDSDLKKCGLIFTVDY